MSITSHSSLSPLAAHKGQGTVQGIGFHMWSLSWLWTLISTGLALPPNAPSQCSVVAPILLRSGNDSSHSANCKTELFRLAFKKQSFIGAIAQEEWFRKIFQLNLILLFRFRFLLSKSYHTAYWTSHTFDCIDLHRAINLVPQQERQT